MAPTDVFNLNRQLTAWAQSFEHFVAMPSVPDAPRGRFGLFAEVTTSQTIDSAEALEPILNNRRSRPQILLLGYELGMSWLRLPFKEPPRAQPLGLLIELGQYISLDGLNGHVAPHTEDNTWQHPPRQASAASGGDVPPEWCPVSSDQTHTEGIETIHEAIKRGDIYQANLTRRFHIKGDLNAGELFNDLLTTNPVGHMAWLKTHGSEVLSNTMETLLEFDPHTRRLASFPIKGTQPRQDDDIDAPELALIPKERAEHIMIVDLIRNDLGRVCTPGSVHVPSLLGIEGYRGVWHGVSKVEGTLRPDATLYDAFAALFPGGSITGAPKRKAVETLCQIEHESRGFYTGSIAVIWPDNRVSASILIRTLVRDSEGWSFNVGGGIVIDSEPERELIEIDEKSHAVKSAIERISGTSSSP